MIRKMSEEEKQEYINQMSAFMNISLNSIEEAKRKISESEGNLDEIADALSFFSDINYIVTNGILYYEEQRTGSRIYNTDYAERNALLKKYEEFKSNDELFSYPMTMDKYHCVFDGISNIIFDAKQRERQRAVQKVKNGQHN